MEKNSDKKATIAFELNGNLFSISLHYMYLGEWLFLFFCHLYEPSIILQLDILKGKFIQILFTNAYGILNH